MADTASRREKTPQAPPSASNLKLVGGRLCLDFVNTVDWHGTDHPKEWLTSFDEFVQWAVHAGAVDRQTAEGLMAAGRARPAEAAGALREALALREAMYRIFAAVAAAREPPADDLEHLNRALARALPRLRLQARPGGFDWAWADDEATPLDRPLWPILASAAELLTSGDLARVRRCADDECGWLFVDMSRNRSRRWCAMEDCGNRAKARRLRQRARDAPVSGEPTQPGQDA
ncbi:MAG: hypothetical protein C4304_09720 [candidate division GAL15 bacterium]